MFTKLFLGFLLSVLFLTFSSFVSSSESPFSSSDSKRSADLILSHHQSDGSFGSLLDTSNAVRALKLLNAALPNSAKTCAKLSAGLKAKNIADVQAAILGVTTLDCSGASLSSDAKSLLQKELNSGNILQIHAAVDSILAAAGDQLTSVHDYDFGAVFPLLKDLIEEDGTFRQSTSHDEGSPYMAGLALQILGRVFAALPDSEDSHRELIRLAVERVPRLLELGITDSSVDFSANAPASVSLLRAAEEVVEGLEELAAAVSEALEVRPEQLDRLAEFFLANRFAFSISDIHSLASALSFLSHNHLRVPLILTVDSVTPSSIKVKVTNVLDQFATPVSVSLSSLSSTTDRIILPREIPLSATSSNVLYELSGSDKWTSTAPGFYFAKFGIDPKAPASSKDKFAPRSNVAATLKVGATLGESTVSAFVSESAKVEEKDQPITAKYPQQLKAKFNADTSKHLHIKLSAAVSGKHRLQSVFLQLLAKDGSSSLFPVKATDSDGVYSLKLNLGSSEFIDSVSGSGEYSLHLLIGDALLSDSVNWSIGSLNLAVPTSSKKAAEDDWAPKKEIQHQFRAPDARPPQFLALAFTGAVAVPFAFAVLFFLAKLPSLSIPTHPSDFLAFVLFFGFIGAILLMYFFYWVKLNIFQAGATVLLLGGGAVVTGSRALRAVYLARARGKGKSKAE